VDPARVDPALFSFAEFDASAGERTGYSNYSYWRSTMRLFLRNKTALSCSCSSDDPRLHLPPASPAQPEGRHRDQYRSGHGRQFRNLPPSTTYWFGTIPSARTSGRAYGRARDEPHDRDPCRRRRDVSRRRIRRDLGYVRKATGSSPRSTMSSTTSHTIVLLLLAYIMRPSFKTMVIAMCGRGLARVARFVRNQIVIIRDREYNLASRCLGTPTRRIIMKNLLPYLVSVIMLQTAISIRARSAGRCSSPTSASACR